MTAPAAHELAASADYFDGLSARPHRVELRHRDGRLLIHIGDEPDTPWIELDWSDVQWPERTRHGARVAHIAAQAGGGELHATDTAQWDRFTAQAGQRDSLVVRSQQSWSRVLVVLLLLVLMAAAGWRWGVPLASQAIVAVVPPRVDAALGQAAFDQIEDQWLQPSRLPVSQQAALRKAFEQALAQAMPQGTVPYRIEFRASRIGPNAFALPGGVIVMTDELVTLVDGNEAVLIGVLAHEYGHVLQRHGMRQLAQTGLLGAVAGIAFGDYSGVLASMPVLLGTLGYSRDFERQADEHAIAVLRGSGRSPAVMTDFFQRLQGWRQSRSESDNGDVPARTADPRTANPEGTDGSARHPDRAPLGIAFSSHPADAERIARFREAAAGVGTSAGAGTTAPTAPAPGR